MSGQTAEELLMAQRLVQVLGLEHIAPDAILPTAPLFGSAVDSVGLDSIDALEIALMIQQQYGVELRVRRHRGQGRVRIAAITDRTRRCGAAPRPEITRRADRPSRFMFWLALGYPLLAHLAVLLARPPARNGSRSSGCSAFQSAAPCVSGGPGPGSCCWRVRVSCTG